MGKKHLQPQPIDIFNAPSPRTLLTTGGVPMKRSRDSSESIIGQALKKPTGSSGQSIITTGGSIIVTPTGSASAFPESPPPETIEDYGDVAQDRAGRSRSADSDDFSSEGDDGNPNHDSSDSLGCDDEEDYDSNEEIEGEEEGEEGEEAVEEESDNEDYEDDDEDATHVNVDFEAVEMDEDDINSVMHLMDQLIPDHLNEVDRDGFGLLLASEPKTTLIQLPPESSAPPTALSNATAGEVEVYGIVSLLNLGAAATSSVVSALAQKVLRGQLWSVVHPGIAPYDILTSKNESGDSKALLLVSEHIRNVPMEVVSKTLAVTLESLDEEDAEAKKKNSKQQKRLMRAVGPSCMFVILAKIQRDAEKAAAITKKEKKAAAAAAGPSAKQKRRTEGGSGSGGGDHAVTLNIEDDFIFWREEDNILYNLRDKRVAVHAHRCRPQYDMQPESERPVTLSFAVTMEGLRRAMTTIETKIATS